MTVRTLVRVTAISAAVLTLASLAMLAATVASWNGNVEAFLILAVLGGVVLAGMRLMLRGQPPIALADPFARDVFSTDTVNVAHVRVAGLGGAGLVVAAMAVALQYPLTTMAVALGLFGGLVGALAVIVWRRLRSA